MSAMLPTIASLHWLRPQWLWALAAVPLLAVWWRTRRRQRSAWRDVVDPHLLAHLLGEVPGSRRLAWPWLGLLGLTLAVCALAGPSWQRAPQPQWQVKSPLIIALDLSTASLANDLPPSRLLQARAKMATLLQARSGGQVGLVAFADDAYTVAPLTDDVANIAVFLDALTPDIMPVDGSRADRAIAWSARLLRQTGFNHGDILLLTDHAGASAEAAAATASRDGYRVSVIGLGTSAGAAYQDVDGHVSHARLDTPSLRAVASAGGGGYVAMSSGDDDLRALDILDPGHGGDLAAQGQKVLVWVDQGYWLLLPLLLLGLLAFRRGNQLALLLLCMWLPWQPAHAAQDWWLRPDQQAHARMEQGAQAYRKGDFAAAHALWRGIPDADAAYNRGNALAKQGDYDSAIAAYDEALQLQPGMPDAIANKRTVEAARRRQSAAGKQPGHQGKGDGQQQSQRGGQQQSAQQKGQQQSGQQQSGQQRGQQQNGEQQKGQAQPPQAPPTSPATQRQADAAQRQRMQEALRRQAMAQRAGVKPGARPSQRAESPAERERRLANEAWLQRVPDDPGGLLRARFQLEYERRQQEGP